MTAGSHGRCIRYYAPINGLSQSGGFGQPRGIRLRKAHMGWDFDIHNNPRGGTFDLTAILKSREDLGMSDEWCTILNIPRIHVSEFSVSKNTVLCREYCVAFFKAKMFFLCPSVLCL